MFTNEFLKFTLADVVNQLETLYKNANESTTRYGKEKNDHQEANQSYYYYLGRWDMAKILLNDIYAKLGKESLKDTTENI